MGNCLWPGDNTQKQVAFLQPSDLYNSKCLALLRAFAAIYFVIHVGLVLFFTFEEFWKYLTNLVYVVVMLNYLVLVYAHVRNGDFTFSLTNEAYKHPDLSSLTQQPYTLYRVVTLFYEFSIHMSLTVAFAFWLIEIPALALKGSVFNWRTSQWIGLIYSHTIPQLVIFSEWTQCNI